MKKQELLKGKEFVFNNKEWGTTYYFNDDFREASVLFSEKLDKFLIFFNGALVHSSKTFKSLENKLSKLSKDWNLSPSEDVAYWHH